MQRASEPGAIIFFLLKRQSVAEGHKGDDPTSDGFKSSLDHADPGWVVVIEIFFQTPDAMKSLGLVLYLRQ